MTRVFLSYSRGQGDADTPDEIDAFLDDIAAHARDFGILVTVTRWETPGTLYVGMNREVGVLYYTLGEAGHYSQGDTTSDVESLTYDMQQTATDFPPDAEVPVSDVRAAVHEYARTGTRPTGVRWQDWSPPRNPGVTIPADDDPAWG